MKGYRFSKKNLSLDWLNGGIVGKLDRDIQDLTLLTEPGEWRFDDCDAVPPGTDSQPDDQPLRGARMQWSVEDRQEPGSAAVREHSRSCARCNSS